LVPEGSAHGWLAPLFLGWGGQSSMAEGCGRAELLLVARKQKEKDTEKCQEQSISFQDTTPVSCFLQ
jgi:hypothetical protein